MLEINHSCPRAASLFPILNPSYFLTLCLSFLCPFPFSFTHFLPLPLFLYLSLFQCIFFPSVSVFLLLSFILFLSHSFSFPFLTNIISYLYVFHSSALILPHSLTFSSLSPSISVYSNASLTLCSSFVLLLSFFLFPILNPYYFPTLCVSSSALPLPHSLNSSLSLFFLYLNLIHCMVPLCLFFFFSFLFSSSLHFHLRRILFPILNP